ncbi:MAG TPA: hypothetical protein VMZ29_00410 [Candidatus Bathyarchaeia archaeon]|nr:hypothetical protein [Candidatus Bathyarchaeia archaeon]
MRKLRLNKTTSLISLILLMFIFSTIIVVPIFVTAKEPVKYSNYIGINDEVDEDDDDDGVNDDQEDQNERSLEVEVDGTEAQIQSEFSSGENQNAFHININAESDKLAIKLEFNNEIDDVELELEFTVEFTELIGYNDINANNIYDPSIDTAVENYTIGGFNDIDYIFQNNTEGELHILSVMSTDGKFGIVAYISNEFMIVNDTLLTPVEIKFDILINNFVGGFERVALKTEFDFQGEVEYDEDTEDEQHNFTDNEAELALNYNDYAGFFSWNQNATTDGVEHPVYNSLYMQDEGESYFYLNYVAGNEIIHDPKIGVANLLIGFPLGFSFGLFFPELSKSGFLILTATAALIAISLSLVAIRRKKN